MGIVLSTNLPGLPPPRRGKVRDVYDLRDKLLIVSTDRVSAYDVVMANGIPDKGKILNQISAHWFGAFEGMIEHHLITIDDERISMETGVDAELLAGRAALCWRADPIPFECVARGYITGSLYEEYSRLGGSVHGLDLPERLERFARLPEPIFTPATKAETGHDQNVSHQALIRQLGPDMADRLKRTTLALYGAAESKLKGHGVLLADTKFEFGTLFDQLVLIDEAVTPDSSRMWVASKWTPGEQAVGLDKQRVRDYVATLSWDRKPPGPELPPEVVNDVRDRYLRAYEAVTGRSFGG